ncbi:hypothetical protein RRG08_056189 [Elysia crispata]|uniref:Uncharacterized protein n=1 Tax=Elysia crispata TaxID=231223 RepID=A0AAE0Z1C2_9GAST|nr:hypothetical protein RRG08_056189 [Elysia crispata]
MCDVVWCGCDLNPVVCRTDKPVTGDLSASVKHSVNTWFEQSDQKVLTLSRNCDSIFICMINPVRSDDQSCND